MTAEETWWWLDESGYFKRQRDENGRAISSEKQEIEWPEALEHLTTTKADLAFEALGGCCRCLDRLKTAERLLTQRNFSLYSPKKAGRQADNMVLDPQAMSNLEIMRAKCSAITHSSTLMPTHCFRTASHLICACSSHDA